MIDALFLAWGLVPLTIGFGFIFSPKMVLKAHKKFEKRRQAMTKKFFKAHRATGLAFVLLGVVMLLTWLHPVWIYNLFILARIVTTLVSGGALQHQASVIPTVWI